MRARSSSLSHTEVQKTLSSRVRSQSLVTVRGRSLPSSLGSQEVGHSRKTVASKERKSETPLPFLSCPLDICSSASYVGVGHFANVSISDII